MTFKVSTGLRNQLLATAPLRTALALGFIKIYSGPEPVTADAAVTGTLLCTISVDGEGTGLSFDAAAADGTISKPTAVAWEGTNVATGTAGYYRHVGVDDTGVNSVTELRIQGRVATSGAEMNLSSTTLANAANQTLDYYSVSLPTF